MLTQSRAARRVVGRCAGSVPVAMAVRAAPAAARCARWTHSSESADSHDDFRPKAKTPPSAAELKKLVDDLVQSNKVVLFMKGTPQQPMCGFSMRVVQLLHSQGVDIHGVDILSNATLRAYMKEYSEWPTFPQLYIAGEFVGGCDIATAMHQSGELGKLLDEKNARVAPTAATTTLK